MKLVIPHECQIGAHKVQIVWSDEYLNELDLRGEIHSKKLLIRLHKEGRTVSQLFETLIHEARHFADYTFGFDGMKDDERNVKGESAAIAQFLLSLGIEPDFSDIQDERW